MHEDSLRFGGFSKGAWPLWVWEKKKFFMEGVDGIESLRREMILFGRSSQHWDLEIKKKNTLFEKSSKHWDLAIKEEDSFGGRTLLEGEIEKSSLWLETIIRLFLERHT